MAFSKKKWEIFKIQICKKYFRKMKIFEHFHFENRKNMIFSFFKISIFSTSHMIFQWFFEMNIFHDIFDFFLSKSFKKKSTEIFSCKYNFLNFQYFLKRLKILTSPSPLVSTKMRLYVGLSKSLAPRGHKKKATFF